MDQASITRKVRRIAFEILEDNYEEEQLIIAGICRDDEGYQLAELLSEELKAIGGPQVSLTAINLDKKDPTASEIKLGLDQSMVDNKVVIIVDDVANTGRTLLYAIRPLLELSPKKIRIAVLVDRQHKAYPVCADYVGTSLSTTLHEHIDVHMGNGVFLS